MNRLLGLVMVAGVAAADVPVKTYDAAQCKARVAVFEKRAQAAADHAVRSRGMARVEAVATAADPGLPRPDVVVMFKPPPKQLIDACSAYAPTLEVRGKKQVSGTTPEQVAAAVKKQRKPGAPIGIYLPKDVPAVTAAPYITELAKLGPLAMHVVTAVPPPIVTTDAPPWALERYRAITAANVPEPFGKLMEDALVESARGCDAHAAAVKELRGDHGDRAVTAAEEFPKAARACACKFEIDAYELFTIASFALARESYGDGWLELALGPTKIAAANAGELALALGKLPRDERRAGVTIEASPSLCKQ